MMRFRIRTLLLVPVLCAVGLVCARLPVSAWSGARWVSLTISVVDAPSGLPISQAEVELVNPFDDERPPVRGKTDAAGSVVLRNLFGASGVDYLVGGTSHVTFNPFVIRVTAKGFYEYRASLSAPIGGPDPKATDPPLNLRDPVPGPITIRLNPAGRDTGRR